MQIVAWECEGCKTTWWMPVGVKAIRCPACEDGKDSEYFRLKEWKKHPLYQWAKRRTGGKE